MKLENKKAGENTTAIPPANKKERSEDNKSSAESQAERFKKQGYIRLWRAYRQHPLYPLKQKKKISPWEAFLDLSIEARGKDSPGFEFEKRIVHLRRGQLITSQRKLAKRWNWSRNSVRNFLSKLERLKIITVSPSNLGRVYSIITFLEYNKLNPLDE